MRLSRFAAIIPVHLLLFPAVLLPQILPPQPGKLNIYSNPAGAIVSINGSQMQTPTNATFVVSPGQYQISVAHSNPAFSCPSRAVQVDAGQTVSLNCTAAGWQ